MLVVKSLIKKHFKIIFTTKILNVSIKINEECISSNKRFQKKVHLKIILVLKYQKKDKNY